MNKHDADIVYGHLQRHHTRDGTRIRFHRRPSGMILELPEPVREDPMKVVVRLLAEVILMLIIVVGILFLTAINV